ncbi:MAG: permease [Pseudomonadota bacterium]
MDNLADQEIAGGGCCHKQASPQPVAHDSAAAESSCCEKPARRDWLLLGSVSGVLISLALSIAPIELAPGSAAATFVAAVSELLGRMWWGLALGVVFVGLLAGVPRDLVVAVLGRRAGLGGMFRATLAGVFLDLCSHGILAVGMKLYERGASTGQVMAFLLASPWNSFSLTLILIGLIGAPWTLAFIALSLVIGITTGLVFDALVARGRLPANPSRAMLTDLADPAELWREYRATWSLSPRGLAELLAEGLRGSRVVLRWALFGLLLAAATRAFLPMESYATWFGATLGGLWLTLLAATVIEVCSEGATPIAADLMTRAAAPGNSFTFLMAGVATDYTEIMSIRDTTRSWAIALCLPAVAVPQVLLIGFVLNQF